jgi:hypothetical protein
MTDRLKILVIGPGRFVGKSRMVETAIAAGFDVEFRTISNTSNGLDFDYIIWDEMTNETKKSPLVYDKRKPKPYYRKGERW